MPASRHYSLVGVVSSICREMAVKALHSGRVLFFVSVYSNFITVSKTIVGCLTWPTMTTGSCCMRVQATLEPAEGGRVLPHATQGCLNSLCLRHCQQHDRLTAWKVHDSLRSTMTLKKSRHQATMRNLRLVFRQHMTSVVQTFKFARLWAELARHVHPCIQRLQALLSLPAQTTLSDSMEGG